MSEERLPCRKEGCDRTIQPATAKRNDGYCGPCYNKIQHEKRQAYIRENRKDVDLYEGVSDPVEMITIMHRPRKYDPLINELPCPLSAEDLYKNLSTDEASRLVRVASKKIGGSEKNAAEDISRCLAAFTDHDLGFLIQMYFEKDTLPPPIAFRGSDDAVAQALIDMVAGCHREINAALLGLAWIGSPRVVDYFAETQRSSPEWAELLYVPPVRYTLDAGWELRDGKRHNLYCEDCLAITAVSNGEADDQGHVLMQQSAGSCPWCKRPFVEVLRIDTTDPRFTFLPEIGDTFCIPTCDLCTCYGDEAYFEQDATGHWQWRQDNKRPDYLPDPDEEWGTQPWASANLRFDSRPARFASDQFLPTTFSQVGGLPAWVQDAAYPACPKCKQTMTFIAQLDNAAFDLCEGFYYAFLCPDCKISATTYQQT